jgi:metal-dependent amidase/aminoacylase/carboxypeptidase family protein
MPAKDAAREAVFNTIRDARDEISTVSRQLFNDPEVGGSEHRAVERLTALLEQHGFEIEREVARLPTAFRATLRHHDREQMRKGLRHGHIAFLVEYDALPDVGHGEGKHLAAAGVMAAAIGTAAALREEFATLTVLGCPGGGDEPSKAVMAKAGVFEEFDVALGLRAVPPGEGYAYIYDGAGDTLASATATITFRSTDDTTHDLASIANSALERYASEAPAIRGHERVELLTPEPEIVDDGARLAFRVFTQSRHRIIELIVDLKTLAERAAGEDGPKVDLVITRVYDDLLYSQVLARRFKTWGENLGLRADKAKKAPPREPTDWGNVSYITPTYQAPFTFTEEPVAPGTRTFALASNSADAFEQAFRAGEALAFTALDLIRDIQFRSIADAQLVKALAARGMQREFRRWLGVHPVLPKQKSDEEDKPKGPRITEFKWVRGPGLPNN